MDNKLILAKEALEKNGFKVMFFDEVDKMKETLLEKIELDKSIAFGGSMTLKEIGLYKDLKDRGNEIYWHWKAKDGQAELKAARDADIYISSTNALTLDGKLVNMDGVGNRVASMFYGHERVYIIVGRNKLTKDLKEARDRIKNIAGPKNAQRLDVDTPCKFTGKCNDCDSPDRICKVEVIIHKNTTGPNINIFLVNEDLGY
ncbi:MAG: LUD domain-containing protein [Tissierellia bacterium]|nr:LUD domain-containing protein [Tissierellia bacterium]